MLSALHWDSISSHRCISANSFCFPPILALRILALGHFHLLILPCSFFWLSGNCHGHLPHPQPCSQAALGKVHCTDWTVAVSLLAPQHSGSFLVPWIIPSRASSLALPHSWGDLQLPSQPLPACSILLRFTFPCPPASQGLSDQSNHMQ